MIFGDRLTLFRIGFFWAVHRWRRGAKRTPLPKICQIYLTMMKLGTCIPYLKKSKKYINHVTHPLSSADISNFSPEISKFCYIKKYMYRLHFDTKFLILLTFLKFLKIVLIKKVIILLMSAKMATPSLLKIMVFWSKGYDIMISVHDVTNRILACDSNYIVDVVMWPNFDNSNISMKEVIIISIL